MRQYTTANVEAICNVSIHAPGRGATLCHLCSHCMGLVSIHAPGRGATLDEVYLRLIFIRFNSRTREGCDHPKNEYQSQISCFNSRTREGCDIDGVVVLARYGVVSIHAPGRGATPTAWREVLRIMFQFTHPGGVRLGNVPLVNETNTFQFTHPGGVRLISKKFGNQQTSFNSRTREGCDTTRCVSWACR